MSEPKKKRKRNSTEVERLGIPIVITTVTQFVDLEEAGLLEGKLEYRIGMNRTQFNDQVNAERAKRLLARQQALKAQRELIRQQQALMALTKTDDKAFVIAFIQMGQGDCCLILTPGGKVILIDCGTTSSNEARLPKEDIWQITVDADWSDKNGITKAKKVEIDVPASTDFITRVRTVLRKDQLLGKRKKIDYLILTHPDDDHYSELSKVFPGTAIKFGEVYHSNALSAYGTNKTAGFIEKRAEDRDKIFRVTHNDSDSDTVGLTTLDGVKAELDQEANGGYLLLNEDNCKIWLLASDVTPASVDDPPLDGSNDTNRGSLVTLIEVFGKKILVCGDATRITEKYLLANSANAFKNLDILQAPHHGSDSTSSSDPFVVNTNPRNVVASASRKDNSHNLPQQNTLRAYFRKMKLSGYLETTAHEIFYWARGSGASIHSFSTLKRPIYTTGSQGSFGWVISRDHTGVKMQYGNL